MAQNPRIPEVGDNLCPLDLPGTDGSNITAVQFAGRPTVLLIYPTEQLPACAQTLDALRDAWPEFQQRGVNVIGISLVQPEQQKLFSDEHQLPFPLASDTHLRVSQMLGALRAKPGQSPDSDKLEMAACRRTLLLARDLRILAAYDNPDPAEHVRQLLADIDRLIKPDPPRRIVSHAPVLLIPDVLPRDLCQRLIEIWETQGNEDSGFMRQVDGQTVGMYDYSHKIRRDHFLKAGRELDEVKRYVGARVVPTIRMAFNYEVSRFEDFRIACYDSARGGYFRPHKDNTTDGTAHRRFAMSLLLNDDYEGGTVRFPEYGLHEYRPDPGGCVVFSCSLLHEATDVTAGRRFVLLTFLYGEKEAKIREEYNRRTGGTYRAGATTTGA